MSSGSIKKDFQNSILERPYNESLMGISESTISFKNLFNHNKKNIYSEIKNIKFSELNPEFKQILKQEFLDAILKLKYDILTKKKIQK